MRTAIFVFFNYLLINELQLQKKSYIEILIYFYCRVLEINGQLIPGQERVDVNKLLISGTLEIVVARASREESYLAQIQDLSNKMERLTQERDALKGDNLRLKHRISYLEEVRHDDELAEEDSHKDNKSNRNGKHVANQSVQQQHDSLSSGESQSLYRSEIRVQGAPVRQKPPRNSKLKTNSNSMGRQHPTVPEIDYADSNKRLTSSLDVRRTTDEPTVNGGGGVVIETGSMSRIKSSIVDRHFGHVIRVTHHHHPHHPSNQHPPPTSSSSASSHDYASRRQRVPADSISVSDLQSVASYDSFVDPHPVRHHHHMGQSMETVSNVSMMPRSFNQRSPPSPTRVIHVFLKVISYFSFR